MPIAPGTLLPLTIDKAAAGGRMIARADGQIVLVAGAIPGERVVARVERVAKGVVYAGVTAVEQPSPDRREAPDPLCGGCVYNHIAYARQLDIKAQVIADAFARIARMELPGVVAVRASREDGYRMRARLHLLSGRIGFFREGTHMLCEPRVTGQLLPASVDALERIAAGHPTGSAEVELSENVPATERSIAIDGRVAFGDEHVHDTLEVHGYRVSWRRHVLTFFQGNRHLLEALVSHVIDQVPAGASVVDLYAGAGLFSVPAAAARGARVTAVEGNAIASRDLTWNSRHVDQGEIRAVHASVEDFAEKGAPESDVVIVDPPRTGMSREALDGVSGMGAQRVVYVSCDVATLARDARRLVDAGYRVDSCAGFDMFPNTPHVETVVVFGRG